MMNAHIKDVWLQYIAVMEKNYDELLTKITQKKDFGSPTLRELKITPLIMKHLKENRFCSIIIIGLQGSGKTTTANYIISNLPPDVKVLNLYFKGEMIKDEDVEGIIKEKIKAENPEIVTVVLDDVTYLLGSVSTKEGNKFKNFIGLIRHRIGKPVLLIMISHLVAGLPPLMRNTNFVIFQTLSVEDQKLLSRTMSKKQFEIFRFLLHNINTLKQVRYANTNIRIATNERAVLFYDHQTFELYKVAKPEVLKF